MGYRLCLTALLAPLVSMPTSSVAQERAWDISARLASFNTYYQENFSNSFTGDPEDIRGNSWSVLALNVDATFHAQKFLPLPVFVGVKGLVSVATRSGFEIGEEYQPSGITNLTQQENVRHDDFTSKIILGWEWRRFLQPYIGYGGTAFTSERTGQQNGTTAGVLVPDPNQDYTEEVNSEAFIVGVRGSVSIPNSSEIIQYDALAEKPTSVSVTNDYFGSGMWGQGTTGYAFGARAELDIPIYRAPWENPMYFAIGGSVTKREWDGNGASAIVWNGDYSQTVRWPQNFYIEAGGYVGLTMSF